MVSIFTINLFFYLIQIFLIDYVYILDTTLLDTHIKNKTNEGIRVSRI